MQTQRSPYMTRSKVALNKTPTRNCSRFGPLETIYEDTVSPQKLLPKRGGVYVIGAKDFLVIRNGLPCVPLKVGKTSDHRGFEASAERRIASLQTGCFAQLIEIKYFSTIDESSAFSIEKSIRNMIRRLKGAEKCHDGGTEWTYVPIMHMGNIYQFLDVLYASGTTSITPTKSLICRDHTNVLVCRALVDDF